MNLVEYVDYLEFIDLYCNLILFIALQEVFTEIMPILNFPMMNLEGVHIFYSSLIFLSLQDLSLSGEDLYIVAAPPPPDLLTSSYRRPIPVQTPDGRWSAGESGLCPR